MADPTLENGTPENPEEKNYRSPLGTFRPFSPSHTAKGPHPATLPPKVGVEVKKVETEADKLIKALKDEGFEFTLNADGGIESVEIPKAFAGEEAELREKLAQVEAMKNGDLSILRELSDFSSILGLLGGKSELLKEKLQNPQTLALLESLTEQTKKLVADIQATPSRVKLDELKLQVAAFEKAVERARVEVSKIPVPPAPAPTIAPTPAPTPQPVLAGAPAAAAAPKAVLRPKGVLTTWPTYIRFDDAKNRNAWWYSKNPSKPEILNSKEWSEAASDIKPIFDDYLSFMKEGGVRAQIKKESLFRDLIAAKEKVTQALDDKQPSVAVGLAHDLREAIIAAKEEWVEELGRAKNAEGEEKKKKEEEEHRQKVNQAVHGVFARQRDANGEYGSKKFVEMFKPADPTGTQQDIEKTRRQKEVRTKFEQMIRNDENGFISLYAVPSIDPATNEVVYTENERLRIHPHRDLITEVLAAHKIMIVRKSKEQVLQDASKQAEKEYIKRTSESYVYSPAHDTPPAKKLSLPERVDKFMLGREPKAKPDTRTDEEFIRDATAPTTLKSAPNTGGMVKRSTAATQAGATENVFGVANRFEEMRGKAEEAKSVEDIEYTNKLDNLEQVIATTLGTGTKFESLRTKLAAFISPEDEPELAKLKERERTIEKWIEEAKAKKIPLDSASMVGLRNAVSEYEKVAEAFIRKREAQSLSTESVEKKQESLKKVQAVLDTRIQNLNKNPAFINTKGVLRAVVLMAAITTAGLAGKGVGEYLNTIETKPSVTTLTPAEKKTEWRKYYHDGKMEDSPWKDLAEEISALKLDTSGDLMRGGLMKKYTPLYFKNSNSVSAALGLDGNIIKYGPKEGEADPYSHMIPETRLELIALWSQLENISMATSGERNLKATTFEEAFSEVKRKVAQKEQ